MRIVIAGGHGQIALLLEQAARDQAGDEPVGIVRNPDHVADLEADGVEAVVLDLEDADVAELTDVVRAPTRSSSRPAAARTATPRARRPSTRAPRSARRRRRAGRRTSLRDGLLDGHRPGRPRLRGRVPGLPPRQAGGRRRPAGRDLDWTSCARAGSPTTSGTGRVQVGALERGESPAATWPHVLAEVLEADNTIGKTFDVLTGHRRSRRRCRPLKVRTGQPVTMLTSFGARTITLRTSLPVQRALTRRVGQRQRLQVGLGDVRRRPPAGPAACPGPARPR